MTESVQENPSQVHGRLNEALHVAGYAVERAWAKLEWLLEGERWKQVGSGFENVNDFMATVQLPPGSDPSQRKAIAKRIKKLQPEVSQRKIAGTLGVSKGTVNRDLGAPNGAREEHDAAPISDGVSRSAPNGALELDPPPATSEIAGDEAAKLAKRRVERKRRDVDAERRRIEEAKQHIQAMPDRPDVDIRHGDFREVLADLEGVDAVMTDPPYGRDHIHLMADLASWADGVLGEDGILAVLMGQHHLPDVYALLSGHRPYRWTACLLTEGPAYVSHASRVQCGWKPVLVYGGGPRFADVVRSEGRDIAAKSHHKWGQDFAAFRILVERLTDPGQTVVDPFMGSGTTLLAAAAIGRHAIGADVDANAVETARDRLWEAA